MCQLQHAVFVQNYILHLAFFVCSLFYLTTLFYTCINEIHPTIQIFHKYRQLVDAVLWQFSWPNKQHSMQQLKRYMNVLYFVVFFPCKLLFFLEPLSLGGTQHCCTSYQEFWLLCASLDPLFLCFRAIRYYRRTSCNSK